METGQDILLGAQSAVESPVSLALAQYLHPILRKISSLQKQFVEYASALVDSITGAAMQWQ